MSESLEILYHDETQLLDWGESRSAGKWIKLRLSETEGDPLAPFRGLDTAKAKQSGHIFNVTIAQGDIAQLANEEESKPKDKPYGAYAQALHQSGFFRTPHVWAALGSDEDYQAWCRTKPCAICNNMGYVENHPEGRCEYMHIRRVANGSGTAIKPAYSGLPGCHEHHVLQHNQGELAAVIEASHYHSGMNGAHLFTVQDAKDWFEKMRIRYLTTWAHTRLVTQMGYSSLAEIPPSQIESFCTKLGINGFLPNYQGR